MEKRQSQVKDRSRHLLEEPRRFRVVFHNDDFTTMEFVVEVLKTVFHKSDGEANMLMLKVHKEGQAVAGIYSKDMAMSKVQKATKIARDAAYASTPTVYSCLTR